MWVGLCVRPTAFGNALGNSLAYASTSAGSADTTALGSTLRTDANGDPIYGKTFAEDTAMRRAMNPLLNVGSANPGALSLQQPANKGPFDPSGRTDGIYWGNDTWSYPVALRDPVEVRDLPPLPSKPIYFAQESYVARSLGVLKDYGLGVKDTLVDTVESAATGWKNIITEPVETGKALVWGAKTLGSMALDGLGQIAANPRQALDAATWAAGQAAGALNDRLSAPDGGRFVGGIVGAMMLPGGPTKVGELVPEMAALQRVEKVAARSTEALGESSMASQGVGAGRSGVYFFDKQALPYIDRANATLGRTGDAQFFMPASDSALITDAASAYRYSGGASSLERAYITGGDVFGVEFPLKDLSPRIPTAADTSLEHFLEGGRTALKLPDGGGYLINPTREFVVPGGGVIPSGSILFKIAPDGTRIPIRSW